MTNDIYRLVARCVIDDDDVPGPVPAASRGAGTDYQSGPVVGDDDDRALNGRVFPLARRIELRRG